MPDFTRGDWNKTRGYRHAFATEQQESESLAKAEAFTEALKAKGVKSAGKKGKSAGKKVKNGKR